jgi:hypothetical protein
MVSGRFSPHTKITILQITIRSLLERLPKHENGDRGHLQYAVPYPIRRIHFNIPQFYINGKRILPNASQLERIHQPMGELVTMVDYFRRLPMHGKT